VEALEGNSTANSEVNHQGVSMPFFAESSLISQAVRIPTIPRCGLCGLYKHCKSPKMPVSGKGKRRILVVAEAPGETEDEQGIQLVGRTGSFFERTWKKLGIDLRNDCWLTNTVICRPTDKGGHNRTPTDKEIEHCLPNLHNTIRRLRPEVIVPIGLPAVKATFKPLWNDSIKDMGRWVGWQIPCQKFNAWICPTYHPSFIMREKDNAKGGSVAPLLFKQHLKAIAKLKGRPWAKVPDYRSEIDVILDDDLAADWLRKFRRRGGAISYDYETNMMKPDSPKSVIRSASVCWKGERTIAFPFQGKAVPEFKRLLKSDCPKIAQNFKFEDRWSWVKLGLRVRNWQHCTMNFAHMVDNRPGCTGLGFLAFVMLGFSSYDTHIHPFLQSDYSNEENRVFEIDIQNLLLYNGIDSLLQYKIADKQCRLLGLPSFE